MLFSTSAHLAQVLEMMVRENGLYGHQDVHVFGDNLSVAEP